MSLKSVWLKNIVNLNLMFSAQFYHPSRFGDAISHLNDHQRSLGTLGQTGSGAVSKAHQGGWEGQTERKCADMNHELYTAEYGLVMSLGKNDNLIVKTQGQK